MYYLQEFIITSNIRFILKDLWIEVAVDGQLCFHSVENIELKFRMRFIICFGSILSQI
ncbi:hypothetical protein SAMCFNEI73_pB0418 (plasmid) [Sinorhizobium americanum]|uniref:Uncharacterized protein n=1 Tax=Sinorhizobium americanum TaxID=194963 RepID=A0A1L3LU44_9HYPH|nr:hypothetical protein SAMCCGM7_pB0385 [Sinorhizobium americanum CCGM7]APG93614.1 hypothetical protein SAMCFNEI73_pB0418 [Sinorhizobium americanum]